MERHGAYVERVCQESLQAVNQQDHEKCLAVIDSMVGGSVYAVDLKALNEMSKAKTELLGSLGTAEVIAMTERQYFRVRDMLSEELFEKTLESRGTAAKRGKHLGLDIAKLKRTIPAAFQPRGIEDALLHWKHNPHGADICFAKK